MEDCFQINVSELQKKHEEKCRNRLQVFNKILEKCYHRVKGCAENGGTHCIFPIPDFILGIATYNIAYCAAYVIAHLRRNGYNAKFYNPNIILITWTFKSTLLSKSRYQEIGYGNPALLLEAPRKSRPEFRTVNDYIPTGNFIHR